MTFPDLIEQIRLCVQGNLIIERFSPIYYNYLYFQLKSLSFYPCYKSFHAKWIRWRKSLEKHSTLQSQARRGGPYFNCFHLLWHNEWQLATKLRLVHVLFTSTKVERVMERQNSKFSSYFLTFKCFTFYKISLCKYSKETMLQKCNNTINKTSCLHLLLFLLC